jgi:hypothetical protein
VRARHAPLPVDVCGMPGGAFGGVGRIVRDEHAPYGAGQVDCTRFGDYRVTYVAESEEYPGYAELYQ